MRFGCSRIVSQSVYCKMNITVSHTSRPKAGNARRERLLSAYSRSVQYRFVRVDFLSASLRSVCLVVPCVTKLIAGSRISYPSRGHGASWLSEGCRQL